MNLKLQRRLAAQITDASPKRIWMDPEQAEKISEAVTKADVKLLISRGVIKIRHEKGISKVRARIRHKQRVAGRRRGHGKRKGAKGARRGKKSLWIRKMRVLRRFLKHAKEKKTIDNATYKKLYRMIKGNYFRDKAHLKLYMRKEK